MRWFLSHRVLVIFFMIFAATFSDVLSIASALRNLAGTYLSRTQIIATAHGKCDMHMVHRNGFICGPNATK